jgi:hypothetical protein
MLLPLQCFLPHLMGPRIAIRTNKREKLQRRIGVAGYGSDASALLRCGAIPISPGNIMRSLVGKREITRPDPSLKPSSTYARMVAPVLG